MSNKKEQDGSQPQTETRRDSAISPPDEGPATNEPVKSDPGSTPESDEEES